MSTNQAVAASGNSAAAAHHASVMDVDPPIDEIAAAQTRDIAGQACTSDAIQTLNELAPGSAITNAHRTVWVNTLKEQMAQLTGPIQRRQIEVASVEAVRKKWMATPSQRTLTSDPELFPLEECAKGEEMKRVGVPEQGDPPPRGGGIPVLADGDPS